MLFRPFLSVLDNWLFHHHPLIQLSNPKLNPSFFFSFISVPPPPPPPPPHFLIFYLFYLLLFFVRFVLFRLLLFLLSPPPPSPFSPPFSHSVLWCVYHCFFSGIVIVTCLFFPHFTWNLHRQSLQSYRQWHQRQTMSRKIHGGFLRIVPHEKETGLWGRSSIDKLQNWNHKDERASMHPTLETDWLVDWSDRLLTIHGQSTARKSQVKFPLTVHCSHHISHSPWRRLGIYGRWMNRKSRILKGRIPAVFWLSPGSKWWTSDSISVACIK